MRYLHNCLEGVDDVCFVSWIEEDKGKQKIFMKDNATFWKCSIEFSTKHYEQNKKMLGKNEETLDERIGERLRSRLYEMCQTVRIQMTCSDYRQRLQGEYESKASQVDTWSKGIR